MVTQPAHPSSITVRYKAIRRSNMPVRSLHSSPLKWPDAEAVRTALAAWAKRAATGNPNVVAIGYIGSYARGDWGVGSDIDLVIIVENSGVAFAERANSWDATSLPVPADLRVYTRAEWSDLSEATTAFGRAASDEARWVYTS
jgi:hypothetical protein